MKASILYLSLVTGLAGVLAQQTNPNIQSIFESIQPYCDSPEYAGCHAMVVKHFNTCDSGDLLCQCNQLYSLKEFCAQSCVEKSNANKQAEINIQKVCGTNSEIQSTLFGLRQLFPLFEHEFYSASGEDDDDDDDDDYDDCDNGDDTDDGSQWHSNDPDYLRMIAAKEKKADAQNSLSKTSEYIVKRADDTSTITSGTTDQVGSLQSLQRDREDCNCGPSSYADQQRHPDYHYAPVNDDTPPVPMRRPSPSYRVPPSYEYNEGQNDEDNDNSGTGDDDDCDDSEEDVGPGGTFRSRLPPGLRRIRGGRSAAGRESVDIVQINALPKVNFPWFSNIKEETPEEPVSDDNEPIADKNSEEVHQSGFFRDHLPSWERLHLPDRHKADDDNRDLNEDAPVLETPVPEAPLPEAPVLETPLPEAPLPETPIVEEPVYQSPIVSQIPYAPEVSQPPDLVVPPVVPSPIYEYPEVLPTIPTPTYGYNSSSLGGDAIANYTAVQKSSQLLRVNALGGFNLTSVFNSTLNSTYLTSNSTMIGKNSSELLAVPMGLFMLLLVFASGVAI